VAIGVRARTISELGLRVVLSVFQYRFPPEKAFVVYRLLETENALTLVAVDSAALGRGVMPLMRDHCHGRDWANSHLDSAPHRPPTHPTPSPPPNDLQPTEPSPRLWHPKLPTRECASVHLTVICASC
jgi:hypothetical protein